MWSAKTGLIAPPMNGKLAAVLLFLPPALFLFTLFVALPMGEAAWYSFYNWNGYGAPEIFVGLKNYALVFQERAFRTALVNNLLIIAVSLAIQLPLALIAALLLADRIRGAVTLRMIFFLPYILAEVAAGLIWRFVYDGDYGLLAKLATTLGFAAPHVLADRDLAMYAILVVIVWKYFGFHMMLYIAGLQQIDPNLYEAAHIDGATSRQMLWRVTFPLLGPTIRLSVFFAVLGSLQLFDLIMPLTKGGPADSTQTMVTYLYSFGVTRMRIGFGSAVGVVLFVICVAFAFGYTRIKTRYD
jgi:raffinose/stachyose/melibiose transport system permease protein